MGFFNSRLWTAEEIPDLTFRNFRNDELTVDIAFLAREAHRDAFILIFKRLIRDNGQAPTI